MTRRLLLAAAALVLAIVGTSAVLAYVNRADARAVSGLDPVQAYIAEKTISVGTSLKQAVDDGQAKLESLPRKTVPADAVTKVTDQLRGQVALEDIPTGSLLVSPAFGAKPTQTDGLPIPNGKMAVSVALDDPQQVGGFVKPGSEIAIFDTFNTVVGFSDQGKLAGGDVTSVAGDGLSDSHNYNRATRLLLARVPVIAVGNAIATPQNLHRSGASSNGQKSSQNQPIVVTVAVNQHDAEKLIEAIQTGYLYFGLLTTESHVDPGAGVNSANLFN